MLGELRDQTQAVTSLRDGLELLAGVQVVGVLGVGPGGTDAVTRDVREGVAGGLREGHDTP